jgi:membrane associated rhomboid family serine protease
MSFIDDARYKYNALDTSGKLITVVVITSLIAWLLALTLKLVYSQLVLPSGFVAPLLQPWSYITHAFIHGGIFHLLGNAIGLHIAGRYMLNLFNGRQYLTLFFMGVLAGGLSYTLATSLIDFWFNPGYAIGASAGVFALVIFCCTYFPDSEIRLLFFNVKLKYLGYAFLAMNLIGLLTRFEAGSSLAHLAGMGLGYWAAVRMREGVDVLEGFAKVGDYFANFFKKSDSGTKKTTRKKAKMKTVYKSATKTTTTARSASAPSQAEIDRILDKISESGYDSLSKTEKDTLFNAGKK